MSSLLRWIDRIEFQALGAVTGHEVDVVPPEVSKMYMASVAWRRQTFFVSSEDTHTLRSISGILIVEALFASQCSIADNTCIGHILWAKLGKEGDYAGKADIKPATSTLWPAERSSIARAISGALYQQMTAELFFD